jgi:hypothetical protein
VFAGVRKLSDAATGVLIETSAIIDNNNGALALSAPSSNGTNSYRFNSKGTVASFAGTGAFAVAPITNVLTGLGNISGDSAILRVNGTQVASSTDDQGTGNFLAYPLYIGRRGGTTLPFNGNIHQLIVRFGPNLPTATIEAAETYVNSKTKAY